MAPLKVTKEAFGDKSAMAVDARERRRQHRLVSGLIQPASAASWRTAGHADSDRDRMLTVV
jgi:hypothetical protein